MDYTSWIIEHLDHFTEDKKVEAQKLIVAYTLLPMAGGYLLGVLGHKKLIMPYIAESSNLVKFGARIAFPVSLAFISLQAAKSFREKACAELRMRIEEEQQTENKSS